MHRSCINSQDEWLLNEWVNMVHSGHLGRVVAVCHQGWHRCFFLWIIPPPHEIYANGLSDHRADAAATEWPTPQVSHVSSPLKPPSPLWKTIPTWNLCLLNAQWLLIMVSYMLPPMKNYLPVKFMVVAAAATTGVSCVFSPMKKLTLYNLCLQRCLACCIRKHALCLVFGASSYEPLSAEAVETFGPMHIPVASCNQWSRKPLCGSCELQKSRWFHVMTFCRLH